MKGKKILGIGWPKWKIKIDSFCRGENNLGFDWTWRLASKVNMMCNDNEHVN